MVFIEGRSLLLLSLIPVIFLLHLLKLRRGDRIVPSVMLWKELTREAGSNSFSVRIRRSLQLPLQIAIISCLTLALARPVTTAVTPIKGGVTSDHRFLGEHVRTRGRRDEALPGQEDRPFDHPLLETPGYHPCRGGSEDKDVAEGKLGSETRPKGDRGDIPFGWALRPEGGYHAELLREGIRHRPYNR
ncbi:TPA: hypothetical protein EYP37_02550 [Candidatus Poribacteria bacterium]|nr:hypothetical protein [Candidatus Poribacteria bacterium]